LRPSVHHIQPLLLLLLLRDRQAADIHSLLHDMRSAAAAALLDTDLL